jgi:hypothetical protein
VEFSDYANETWRVKSLEQLSSEVDKSVKEHGYAMLVIHPQELMVGGKVDEGLANSFTELIDKLSENYSFCTIRELIEVLS